MAEYRLLLDEFDRRLKQRVEAGEIQESTRKTYLRDANRLFESLIWAFSEEALMRMTQLRGFGGSYGKVARDLKAIVDERER